MMTPKRAYGSCSSWQRPVGVLSVMLLLIIVYPMIAVDSAANVMTVQQTDDFDVKLKGIAETWERVPWATLNKRQTGGLAYDARVKMLYSAKGLYVLMHGSDRKLTATKQNDFENLWTEDVFEVFLWTDERHPVYFEYEVSPLGKELPIIIPNLDGRFYGWRPWHYDKDRRIQKEIAVVGGKQESGASIEAWWAEVFIPYDLLKPLRNVPPKPGSRWRANFYRVDHDDGQTTTRDWSRVGPSFHDFKNFGTLVFE